ncbi:MAG TPA: PEP-CTERM sorting domain-containing protein [Kamptonema sp.]|nr:PEP-CTERM sorting domain-containing protein [Kamptonema sp.]
MSKLLTQLTFGLTAAAAVGFYYLAAAPPALAQVDVCGPGNFSDSCPSDSQLSSAPTDTISDVYTTPQMRPSTSVPEPNTAIALLMTGVGIIYSAKKRKQIRQER